MSVTVEAVESALKGLVDPNTHKDYVSSRSARNIRVDGTAVSLARSLVAVIEHYQNADGTLRVPEVLRPYLGGRDVL